MKKPIVLVLIAGCALSVAACPAPQGPHPEQPITEPPPEPKPEPLPEPMPNPPAPETQSALPSWDDVPSGHPEGATNPPRPVLIVNVDGATCYKKWEGGMVRSDGDRVEDCATKSCGTAIQCPPQAPELYAAWKAGAEAPPEK